MSKLGTKQRRHEITVYEPTTGTKKRSANGVEKDNGIWGTACNMERAVPMIH
jgi:hypothetical protein